MNPWFVTSFYRFIPLEDLPTQQAEIRAAMEGLGVLGLVLVAKEGLNGTVASQDQAAVEAFKDHIRQRCDQAVTFKDSQCFEPPFVRVSVDIRQEIVGMKRPDLVPDAPENHHLSAEEWDALLTSDRPKLLIDTRNDYEVKVGKFRGAIDPGLKKFSEWGDYLRTAELPRDVPVMIYCTGGIRCEKAILEMRDQGFQEVYQLRDGILGYLAERPEGTFEGECYVFDKRVAVDASLAPTQIWGTCPGCGLPAEKHGSCVICGDEMSVCEGCQEPFGPVCSKKCRDLWVRHGGGLRGTITGKDVGIQ